METMPLETIKLTHVLIFFGILIRVPIVKFQENTNKCTILQYEVFTLKAIELRNVSTLLGSSSGSVRQYLYKAYIINT